MFGFIKKIIQSDQNGTHANEIETGWQIKIISGDDEGKKIDLNYAHINLGRKDKNRKDDSENSIRFEEQSVSYNQAHLTWHPEEKKYGIIHDRKPIVNYTNVNSVPLKIGEEVMLESNDVVRMGNLVLKITKPRIRPRVEEPVESLGIAVGSAAQEPVGLLSKRKPEIEPPQPEENGIKTGYKLRVIEGPDKDIITGFNINKEVIHIGRRVPGKTERGNAILLNDGSVSSRQAELFWNAMSGFLEIKHVKNARSITKVKKGGKEDTMLLTPGKGEPLKDKDIIIIGDTRIEVMCAQQQPSKESAPPVESLEVESLEVESLEVESFQDHAVYEETFTPKPAKKEEEELEVLGGGVEEEIPIRYTPPSDLGRPEIPAPNKAKIGRDEYLAARIRAMSADTEEPSDHLKFKGNAKLTLPGQKPSLRGKSKPPAQDKPEKKKPVKSLFSPRKPIETEKPKPKPKKKKKREVNWKTDTIELETPFGGKAEGLEDLGEEVELLGMAEDESFTPYQPPKFEEIDNGFIDEPEI